MTIEPGSHSRRDAYFFAISLIVPRPIAFVTSSDAGGLVNAAPFSYFNGLFSQPALVSLSIAKKKDKHKDTVNNIARSGEFCINLVNHEMAEGVTISAAEFPPDISEMAHNGLNLLACDQVNTSRVAESPASMECKLVRIIDDLGPFSLVIGEVVLYHVVDEILDENGYIDVKKANFLGRLGGSDFCAIGDVLTIPRKPWEDYLS